YFNNKNIFITGAGVDDKTAFCIDNNGIGEVMGTGSVSIFSADEKTAFNKIENEYIIDNLKCNQLTDGWMYDLNSKQISYIPPSAKPVDTSRTDDLPLTDIWLTGSDNIPVQLSYSLNKFLTTYNPFKVTIISYSTNSSTVNDISAYINSGGRESSKLFLTSASLNDDSTIQKITSADVFVFVGDDLAQLTILNDSTTIAAMTFMQKILSGTPLFMFGSSGKISGKYFVGNTDNDTYAAYEGRMTINDGLKIFDDFVFQPKVFADNSYFENRVGAVLLGLMRERRRYGVYLDGYDILKISHSDNTISSEGLLPLILIDASGVTFVDSSKFRMSGGIAPRQIVAMNNLRYSLTSKDGLPYSFINKKFDYTTDVTELKIILRDFVLMQNYPNPFNPDTKIKFEINSL
ncbi:MAG: hypothetical protein K8H86_03900, partial [Ignavibacteriaceae bacterium]|nr:hypothetical protein [Ignavibacteriaceae bacterium]